MPERTAAAGRLDRDALYALIVDHHEGLIASDDLTDAIVALVLPELTNWSTRALRAEQRVEVLEDSERRAWGRVRQEMDKLARIEARIDTIDAQNEPLNRFVHDRENRIPAVMTGDELRAIVRGDS